MATGKQFEYADDYERLDALCKLIASRSRVEHARTSSEAAQEGKKRVYYFSLEFLIGPLLENYLLNYDALDVVQEGLELMGASLETIAACEVDPGLGNGGLGRLAACFLDSMAAEGIIGNGNGLRYRYGLFRQDIVDGRQVEVADDWLAHGFPWETRHPEQAVKVTFGGHVVRHAEGDRYWFTLEGGETVNAVPYDVPIVGFGGETVNTLRLWSAEPLENDFDLDAFNAGDYAAASRFQTDVEAISAILYPNDAGEQGRILRLKQEYLFVAAGIGSIITGFKSEHRLSDDTIDWALFPERVAIHTNDTHPALAGVELMRVLIDDEGLDWNTAWEIVTSTISYTNHTVLPEALEQWPIEMFRKMLPRVYMYIEEIDRRYRESFEHGQPGWSEALHKTAILWDGQVRMANLSIICSHSVNGVAEIHTEILERDVLKDFYVLTPEKFNNKTNGISHRRFLANANPALAHTITEAIGDKWLSDANELARLKDFENDLSFLIAIDEARRLNKERLARYIAWNAGVSVDPSTVFDVQVKRFHAYKRQLLNIFKVMDLYNRMLADPSFKPVPTTFIFAGKAASAYTFAKEVIRLINSVAAVVNEDERIDGRLKVAFIPNFAVSNAQLIYPAADISEQISTAGMEASGTSNMKLMMNGAITLGTLDGANVEIARLVGRENMKIFGLSVEEVEEYKSGRSYYDAWNACRSDPHRLGKVVEQLTDGTFAELSGNFNLISDSLLHSNDADFVLKDFYSYVQAWEELTQVFDDRARWTRMSLANIANSGWFSSDRTIREYAREIWHVKPRDANGE